jgi:hypothetical protein
MVLAAFMESTTGTLGKMLVLYPAALTISSIERPLDAIFLLSASCGK